MNIINDCLKIVREHISQEKLENYQLTSNGLDYQHVRYLHFHLKSEKK
jgi:Holliday junction resolvasome RuvABC ATP-dependent DNA helicase subunit